MSCTISAGSNKPGQRAEREVRRPHDEHAELRAQPYGEEIDEGLLPAVRVEDDELAQPGARDAAADVGPDVEQRRVADRKRAREARVLRAQADVLGRQDEQGYVGGPAARAPPGRSPSLISASVDKRQMRAVLLDGRDGQQRDGSLGVDAAEIRRRQVLPVAAAHRAVAPCCCRIRGHRAGLPEAASTLDNTRPRPSLEPTPGDPHEQTGARRRRPTTKYKSWWPRPAKRRRSTKASRKSRSTPSCATWPSTSTTTPRRSRAWPSTRRASATTRTRSSRRRARRASSGTA